MGWRVRIDFLKGKSLYIHLDSFSELEWKLGAYSEAKVKRILIERQEEY